ncbi:hypothetical protein BU26DRAFT_514786 [Trematosphaeria pertusa]|uniref:Uncharacterized protein n=1 Tax=Trematosphaeria pertusa TaxID=390896 RepID=A0A6A6IX66_9PLEO|nr:uncharacterized protein BU26DRAFT_514786 [Trematosphaeria pertusa]KAF2254956.1 hypothetical protein BU26DRAFT_514786 [Trematosphaeria pertusa]
MGSCHMPMSMPRTALPVQWPSWKATVAFAQACPLDSDGKRKLRTMLTWHVPDKSNVVPCSDFLHEWTRPWRAAHEPISRLHLANPGPAIDSMKGDLGVEGVSPPYARGLWLGLHRDSPGARRKAKTSQDNGPPEMRYRLMKDWYGPCGDSCNSGGGREPSQSDANRRMLFASA